MADDPKAASGGLAGIAFALFLWVMVAASVAYFFRYGVPELASDRAYLDSLYNIILAITGVAFVLYQVALGWVVWRYRDRPGAVASNWHESHRLEMFWTLGTAVILVPIVLTGLVYWERVNEPAPDDAVTVIAVGAQFQWDFHYPGADGEFGRFNPELYAIDNQIGLDGADPAAADDWVLTNQLVLPVDRPARILLRLEGRPARLLPAQLPGQARPGSGHEHRGVVHADQDRQLRGGLRRAVRSRPLPDARLPRGHGGGRLRGLGGPKRPRRRELTPRSHWRTRWSTATSKAS